MKLRPALIIISFCVALSGCSAPSGHLYYAAITVEQMKNSKLVGVLVNYCLVGEVCNSYSRKYMWVAKQDENGITANNGESVPYSDIQQLVYQAPASDEMKDNVVKGLLLPAMIFCNTFSNSCWH